MPLKPTLTDREFDKFDVNSADKTAVRVIGTDTTPAGYSAVIYSQIEINDTTWTSFTTGLNADTGSVGLQNDSGAEIRFRQDDVVGYFGWRIFNSGEVFFDLEQTAVIYVKASPGSGTVKIGRLELIK